MHSLDEVLDMITDLGEAKVKKSLLAKSLLGFVAGAMVSIGYLSYVYLAGNFPGATGHILGSFVFPIGLIIILMVGGELITGNMTVVATAFLNKKVSLKELLGNWFVITIANAVGAVFIAAVFGIYLGMTLPFGDTVNALAVNKVSMDAGRIFVSGIACNWIVGLAVWLFMVMKGGLDKLVGAWFPTMVFVLLSFQHSVANVFLFTLGVYNGSVTVGQSLNNLLFSYSGNMVGGAVMVAFLYTAASGRLSKGTSK